MKLQMTDTEQAEGYGREAPKDKDIIYAAGMPRQDDMVVTWVSTSPGKD